MALDIETVHGLGKSGVYLKQGGPWQHFFHFLFEIIVQNVEHFCKTAGTESEHFF